MIRHLAEVDLNIAIEMFIDEDAKKIEWEGLPTTIAMIIEQDYEMVKSYPLVCINMAIAQEVESIEGLRPYAEIYNIVKQSIEIK